MFLTEREEALQPQSKLALKKLLNKIRSQKDQWASKSEAEVQSDIQTIESGTLPSEERLLCDLEPGHNAHGDSVSEAKGKYCFVLHSEIKMQCLGGEKTLMGRTVNMN